MRTRWLLFFGPIIFTFAFPASAQPPPYCTWSYCVGPPPYSYPCDRQCFVCPGTCYESEEAGCPDCFVVSNCGYWWQPPHCIESSGFSGLASLHSQNLPNLTPAEPNLNQPRAPLPLQVALGLCASGGDSSPRP
jgi:hypothetical protein